MNVEPLHAVEEQVACGGTSIEWHGCRVTMERIGQLEPRISVLEDDFDEEALEAEAGQAEAAAVSCCPLDTFPSRIATLPTVSGDSLPCSLVCRQ